MICLLAWVLRIFCFLLPSIVWPGPQAHVHRPHDFLDHIHGRRDASEQIYQHYCSLCHDDQPQIPMGAPRVHHREDWIHRWSQTQDELWKHMSEGIGTMPPRGGCFECSDEDLRNVLLWLQQQPERRK